MNESNATEKPKVVGKSTIAAVEVGGVAKKSAPTAPNPFCILGRGAPIFTAMFSGVEFPVKDRDDLIHKAGGKDRLLIIQNPAGGEIVYSLMDVLDSYPGLEKLFPMQSAESLAAQFARLEIRRKRDRKTSPLLKIGGKHISELNRTRVSFRPQPRRKIQFAGFPKSAPTGAALIQAFRDEEGLAILKGMPIDSYQFFEKWLDWLFEHLFSSERRAALAAATRAEEQANAAETAADAATQSTMDVAGAPTNEAAQQAVDETCSSAGEATRAAQESANAAAEACAHAGAVPDDTEAQAACSRARDAASRAQAAADRAEGSCQRARDIASIGIVTICGHVTESDPCCDDDADGVTIEVCNVNYPEIPAATTTTDGNGNYCVTGRFGHSSRVGCSTVRITMNSGPNWGDVSQTKQITVCSNSPANVNFTFDAPGVE